MFARKLKFKPFSIVILSALCLLTFSFAAHCADSGELADYKKAVTNAQLHSIAPANWKVTDLQVIRDAEYSVVRTFIKHEYMPGVGAGRDTFTYSTLGSGVADSSDATWVTTGAELKNYWQKHNIKTTNIQEETFKVLGMPTKKLSAAKTHDVIYEFKVKADLNYIQRPTRDPSIASQPMALSDSRVFIKPDEMSQMVFEYFQHYYRYWLGEAFKYDDASRNYPWTQLGYTYRWGKGDSFNDIKGLSEFIVLGGTPVKVHAIYTIQSMLYNDGDGTGNFKVSGSHGPVDWILAGRRYQSSGERIHIQKDGVVKDGKGILIFSPGYTLVNDGLITVSTDIGTAVLFSGDTTWGGSGRNILENTGKISANGAAIRAYKGDTVVDIKGGEIRGAIALGTGYDELKVTGAAKLYLPIDLVDASLSLTSNDVAPISGVELLSFYATTEIYLETANISPEKLVGKRIKIFGNYVSRSGMEKVKFVNYEMTENSDGSFTVNKYTPSYSDTSGGGCNAGFAQLLLLVPIMCARRFYEKKVRKTK